MLTLKNTFAVAKFSLLIGISNLLVSNSIGISLPQTRVIMKVCLENDKPEPF